MGSLCENDMPSYSFNWVVKNSSLCFMKPEEMTYSPEFSTNFLSTKWMFFLLPSSSEGSICLFLQRGIDNGPESVRIFLEDITLICGGIVIVEENSLDLTYEKGDANLISKMTFHHEDLIEMIQHSTLDKLRISCRLEPDPSVFDCEALSELSKDMKTLFLNPEFCDITLSVKEKKLAIHRAIFEARASGLSYQCKRKLGDGTFLIPIRNVETTALHELLYFMYTAQLDPDSKQDDISPLDTAVQMGIPNFKSRYFLGSSEWNACTTLKCKKKFYRFTIDRTKKDNFHTKTYCVGNVEWSFRSHFSNSLTEENVSVRFYATKILPVSDLNIRFVVSMQSYCGSDLASKIAYSSIKSTDKLKNSRTLNLRFVKGDDASTKTISLVRFLYVSVEVWSSMESAFPRVKCMHPFRTTDILALSWDLLQLFESESIADVIIIVPDGKFRVHKAILVARSPVFSRMFKTDMQEKTKSEVIIVDFRKNVIAKLLKFMYCAQIVLDDIEETIELAYAADKYSMLLLRDKCLRFLRDQYDKKYMLHIYALFDCLNCDELKEGFGEYIRQIFRRSYYELEQFKTTSSYLYSKIYHNRMVSDGT